MQVPKPQLVRFTKSKNYRKQAIYRCACGNEFETLVYNVDKGRKQTCGCHLMQVLNSQAHTKHDMSFSPTYSTWRSMVKRCTDPNNQAYERYKGLLSDSWRSFEKFYEDMGERPDSNEYTIDRIDNEKGYCKENCRWASMKTQQRNRGNTLFVTANDKRMRLTEFAETNGITYSAAYMRLVRGKLKGVERC